MEPDTEKYIWQKLVIEAEVLCERLYAAECEAVISHRYAEASRLFLAGFKANKRYFRRLNILKSQEELCTL